MSKHIVILTPKYDGREHAGHARSIRTAFAMARVRGWKIDYIDGCGSPVLPRVRDILAAQALQLGADEIVLVDSDIAFSGRTFEQLIDRDCDLVGAAPQARMKRWDDGAQLSWKALPNGRGDVDETGLMPVAGLGAGFMKIRRRVFEAMAPMSRAYVSKECPPEAWAHLRRYFPYEFEPVDASNDPHFAGLLDAFNVPAEQRYVDTGEDYPFCVRARELGFECYVDADIEVDHHEGRCVLDLSLKKIEAARAAQERFQQQQAGENSENR